MALGGTIQQLAPFHQPNAPACTRATLLDARPTRPPHTWGPTTCQPCLHAHTQPRLAPTNNRALLPGRRLMGPGWSNRARLPDDVLQALMELPGTRGMGDLRVRAEDLTAWKLALQKG
jgi:hypothetical protein